MSHMPNDLERFEKILTKTDKNVWRMSGYPSEHRPDIDTLIPTMTFGKSNELPIHPKLKSELQQQHTRSRTKYDIRETVTCVWYNALDRQLVVYKRASALTDPQLNPHLWFAAASDTSLRLQTLPADQYNDQTRDYVNNCLREAFKLKGRPTVDQTAILKSGFRRLLMADNLVVGDMVTLGSSEVQQIYPTTVEIVTHHIAERWGDVNRFDRDTRNHLVTGHDLPSEPTRFTDTLFEVFTYINWRDILTAFCTGDKTQAIEILGRSAGSEEQGGVIFDQLKNAIESDQIDIDKFNSNLIAQLYQISLN
jgi:hypothetical protein